MAKPTLQYIFDTTSKQRALGHIRTYLTQIAGAFGPAKKLKILTLLPKSIGFYLGTTGPTSHSGFDGIQSKGHKKGEALRR